MDANGGGQTRISFGGGRCATPEWSPRGDQIAFAEPHGLVTGNAVIYRNGSSDNSNSRQPCRKFDWRLLAFQMEWASAAALSSVAMESC